MGELEERLNAILGDPEQMEKIARLAKKLTGGESGPEPPAGDSKGPGAAEDLGLDPAALLRIGRLMSAGSARDSDRQALLAAMRPYLSEKRRNKMDKAIRMARLAKMAQLAMGTLKEDGDV